jgi:tight adherence protein C
MRLRRAQWGEKAAAEAEVQIVFPGMLVMLACLIVVVAPMVLPAAFNIFND